MADYSIALQTKPVDLATPLLTAAKIRASEMEQRQNEFNLRREVLGQEFRGLAAVADSPEKDRFWTEAHQRLVNQGIISPEAATRAGTSYSPLLVQMGMAATQSPELAFREKQLAQQTKERAQTFGLEQEKFAEAKRQHGIAEQAPVSIGQGPFGEEVKAVRIPGGGYGRIDPRTGQVLSLGAAPSTAVSIPPEDLAADVKAGRNVEFLKSLDPEQQAAVRKMANYELNPNSLSIRGGHRERMLAAVSNFDPSYDQKNFPAFSEGLKKFQTGPQGNSVRSFSVATEHLSQLIELGRALEESSILGRQVPRLNQLQNWVQENLGQPAPTNFNGLKTIIGQEIVKAIVGAGGTGEERSNAAKSINAASSPAQLVGLVDTYKKAMGVQIGNLQRQYEQSTGRKDFDRLLSPQAIEARDRNAPTSASPINDRPEIVKARNAIARGIPRAKVEEALRKDGIKFEPRDLDMQ